MNSYELIPGVGIGPVRLGMTRSEARAALEELGLAVEQHSRWGGSPEVLFAENNGFQVFFDKDDRVTQIEVSAPPNASRREGAIPDFKVRYGDLDIFETKAMEIVAAIDSPVDKAADRPKLDVSFPRLGLLFWRDDDDRGNVERRSPYFEGLLVSAPSKQ